MISATPSTMITEEDREHYMRVKHGEEWATSKMSNGMLLSELALRTLAEDFCSDDNGVLDMNYAPRLFLLGLVALGKLNMDARETQHVLDSRDMSRRYCREIDSLRKDIAARAARIKALEASMAGAKEHQRGLEDTIKDLRAMLRVHASQRVL